MNEIEKAELFGLSLDAEPNAFGESIVVRDKRWENVEAYVGFPQGYIYEGDNTAFDATKITQFRIEVRYGKNVFYSNILVSNQDLEEARFRIYQFTLDKMVEQIDNYMRMSPEELEATST